MFLSDFDYELPAELIASRPSADRRGSRLLVVDRDSDGLDDRMFTDLPALLRAGDLLVLNDTRVVKARLLGRKDTGGKIEALVERVLDGNCALAQLRASKAPKAGAVLRFDDACTATVTGRQGSLFELKFSLDVGEAMERFGQVPLPPYIERAAEPVDADRYQTVYARTPGAAAAPTAGLHFDEAMLRDLEAKGIAHTFVTLHVGAGTFQALRHEAVEDNRLHSERIEVGEASAEAIRAARAHGGRIVAVGTTSVRTLEAATGEAGVEAYSGETELFIRPGYEFQSVDALITNFHLPRSSLLMLVSALAGRERMLAAYRHAVTKAYRFFSYGDAMLILPGAAER